MAHRPDSSAAPLAGLEALAQLAPNVLLTEPAASQRHLDTVAALIERCRCYRFETGTDLPAACRLIAALATEAADA